MKQKPRESSPGGTLYVASAAEYPVSSTMTGWFLRLKQGALHEPHWHPNASELHYVVKGQRAHDHVRHRQAPGGREVGPGECAYVPQGCGHTVQNIGSEPAEVVGVLNSGVYSESSLSAWLVNAPRHLLANNFGLPEASIAAMGAESSIIAEAG